MTRGKRDLLTFSKDILVLGILIGTNCMRGQDREIY